MRQKLVSYILRKHVFPRLINDDLRYYDNSKLNRSKYHQEIREFVLEYLNSRSDPEVEELVYISRQMM